MRVFLEYAVNLVNKRAFLRAGYRLCVGSSRLADLPIDGAPQLEPQHFELVHSGDRVVVRNLAQGKPLLVNQSPTSADVALNHDDRISAGGLTFRLIVEHEVTTAAVPIAVGAPAVGLALAVNSASPPPSDDPSEQNLPSGVTRRVWSGPQWQKSFWTWLKEQTDGDQWFCLANYKLAQLPVPSECNDENDLLRNASDSLRSEQSLHLLGNGDFGQTEKIMNAWIENGKPLTLFHSTQSREELQDKLQLYASWMSEPKTLSFHLQQNMKRLLSEWFKLANGFAIYPGMPQFEYYHSGAVSSTKQD